MRELAFILTLLAGLSITCSAAPAEPPVCPKPQNPALDSSANPPAAGYGLAVDVARNPAARRGNRRNIAKDRSLSNSPVEEKPDILELNGDSESFKPKNLPKPDDFSFLPHPWNFALYEDKGSGYSLLIPAAFGKAPLSNVTDGSMVLRSNKKFNLFMGAAVFEGGAGSALEFAANAAKVPRASWMHKTALDWDCLLSAFEEADITKFVFEASARAGSKICRLVYVMPAEAFATYFPQAVYSLDSFKLA